MTEIERRLFDLVRGLCDETDFVKSAMLFARVGECEDILIEAIENGDIESRKDMYDLIELVYESNN